MPPASAAQSLCNPQALHPIYQVEGAQATQYTLKDCCSESIPSYLRFEPKEGRPINEEQLLARFGRWEAGVKLPVRGKRKAMF